DLLDVMDNLELKTTTDLTEIISLLLEGYCVLMFEGEEEAFLVQTTKQNNSSTDEPENEKVVRGSHQEFVESIDINRNLKRKRIINRQLIVQYYELGQETNTNVAIVYMKQLADTDLVNDIEKKISSISTNTIFSTGLIEQYIEEFPLSPFPQIIHTERPDR